MSQNEDKLVKKGRILRVKHGYNPNSSSMGSIVFILPASLIAVTVGFGAVSSVIMSMFMKNDSKSGQEQTEGKSNNENT
jgi:hypothetical protein